MTEDLFETHAERCPPLRFGKMFDVPALFTVRLTVDRFVHRASMTLATVCLDHLLAPIKESS